MSEGNSLNPQLKEGIDEVINSIISVHNKNLEYSLAELLEIDYDSDDSNVPRNKKWQFSSSHEYDNPRDAAIVSYLSEQFLRKCKTNVKIISKIVEDMIDSTDDSEDYSFDSQNDNLIFDNLTENQSAHNNFSDSNPFTDSDEQSDSD